MNVTATITHVAPQVTATITHQGQTVAASVAPVVQNFTATIEQLGTVLVPPTVMQRIVALENNKISINDTINGGIIF